jgi:hypothetical protein
VSMVLLYITEKYFSVNGKPVQILVWTDKYPINDDVRCPFYLLFIFERQGNTAVATIYLYYWLNTQNHRVYRVPGILSSRPNWVPPTPPARECCPSTLFVQKGRHTRFLGRGCEGTQFRRRDRHSGTLCTYIIIPLRSKPFVTEHSGKTFAIFEQDKFKFTCVLKIVK